MAKQPTNPLADVADTSGLTDADWAEINKLSSAYEEGGRARLSKALDELTNGDPVRSVRILGAFFPDMIREVIKDAMAERGITEEELRELVRKLESPTLRH